MLLYKESHRRDTLLGFIEKYGPLTLDGLKELYRNANMQFPFSSISDDAIDRWIRSIDEVEWKFKSGRHIYAYRDESSNSDSSMEPSVEEIRPLPRQTVDREYNRKRLLDHDEEKNNRPECCCIQKLDNNPRPNSNRPRRGSKSPPRKNPKVCQFMKTFECNAPNLLGFPLIGDDHFLNIAAFSLGFPAEKPDTIRQCGLCSSGLRLGQAATQVEKLENGTAVIINVGTVDILEGRHLINMVKDFYDLIQVCMDKSITPIVTTLPPIPNSKHGDRQQVLESFNHFLRCNQKDYGFPLIDLNLCMKDKSGKPMLRLYQPEPRYISGSKRKMLMWNRLGRDSVLRMLKKNLGEVLVFENYFGKKR